MKPLIKYIGLSDDNKSVLIIPTKAGIPIFKKEPRLTETVLSIAKQDVMAFKFALDIAAKYLKVEYRLVEDRLTLTLWLENESHSGIILPLFLHDNTTIDGEASK